MTLPPVQLESHIELFDKNVFTPSDVYFVRGLLAGVPASITTRKIRLAIRGRVKKTVVIRTAEVEVIEVPAIVATFSIRASPAVNGVTARWVTPAEKGIVSTTCSIIPACKVSESIEEDLITLQGAQSQKRFAPVSSGSRIRQVITRWSGRQDTEFLIEQKGISVRGG